MHVAVVISGDHNDPESWREWSDKEKQKDYTARFKRRLAANRTEKSDPVSMLVVNNMLITGFDAPVEQVMYFMVAKRRESQRVEGLLQPFLR